MKNLIKTLLIAAIAYPLSISHTLGNPDNTSQYGNALFAKDIGSDTVDVEIELLNYGREERLKNFHVTISLVTLSFGQIQEKFEYVGEGVFKLSVPRIYNYQQGWLKIGNLFYGEVILSDRLRIEVDTAQVKAQSKYKTEGVLFSGPDGTLSRLANEFISFRRKAQLDIMRKMSEAKRSGNSFDEISKVLEALRDEHLQIARDFDPIYYEEWGRKDIQDRYLSDLLVAYMNTPDSATKNLYESSHWNEIVSYEPHASTNNQAAVLRYVGMCLWRIERNSIEASYQLDIACEIARETLKLPQNLDLRKEHQDLLDMIKLRQQGEAADYDRLSALLRSLEEIGLLQKRYRTDLLLEPAMRRLLPSPIVDAILISDLPDLDESVVVKIRLLNRMVETPVILEYLRYLEKARAEKKSDASYLAFIESDQAPALFANKASPSLEGSNLYEFPDLSGSDIYASLRKSFPRESLLIDFWGPWCQACVADLPYANHLHEALKNEPIQFVYFGCRTTRRIWEQTIQKYKLEDIHILLNNGQEAEIMKHFKLSGFPSLLFIDSHGKQHPNAIERYKTANPAKLARLSKP